MASSPTTVVLTPAHRMARCRAAESDEPPEASGVSATVVGLVVTGPWSGGHGCAHHPPTYSVGVATLVEVVIRGGWSAQER
ncbi:hypothetical protein GCM10027517_15140 [Phycicoccus ginsengisoli]